MIYVHIPFCKSFCTYCGFYSVIPDMSCDDGLDGERDSETAQCTEGSSLAAVINSRTVSSKSWTGCDNRAAAGSSRAAGSNNWIGDNNWVDGSSCATGSNNLTYSSGNVNEIRQYQKFTDAVCRELRLRREEIVATKPCNTLYLGGGTPSVLPLDCISQIASSAREICGEDFIEFTMEMNPDDIVRGGVKWAAELREIGVNRASVGIQSFDDGVLRKMNRRHDVREAVDAYHILEEAGFDNISIDLVFGLPSWFSPFEKDLDRLHRDIETALSISSSGKPPKHISAYQLSVEPDSVLEAMMRKDDSIVEAPQEVCAEQYELLCRALSDAGYNHYEVSNYALPGYEAVHNSAYWSYLPYAGFGPAAHSFCIIQSSSAPSHTQQQSLPHSNESLYSNSVSSHSSQPLDSICPKCHQFLSGQQSPFGDVTYLRKWNVADVNEWERGLSELKSPNIPSGGDGISAEVLTPEQVAEEHIMLALRTSHGIPYKSLEEYGDATAMEKALKEGLLSETPDGNIRIPEKYFFISDSIISSLFK